MRQAVLRPRDTGGWVCPLLVRCIVAMWAAIGSAETKASVSASAIARTQANRMVETVICASRP